MELYPKKGIGKLLFGMKRKDVESVMGKPDSQFEDDDKNVIYVYNNARLRLTFYEDEDLRFGYLITSNPDISLSGATLIGRGISEVKHELPAKTFKSWENEQFDIARNHFNEDNWLILQEEFGLVSKVEMGAVFNDKDEFAWSFNA